MQYVKRRLKGSREDIEDINGLISATLVQMYFVSVEKGVFTGQCLVQMFFVTNETLRAVMNYYSPMKAQNFFGSEQ